jgi:hypothetical protein
VIESGAAAVVVMLEAEVGIRCCTCDCTPTLSAGANRSVYMLWVKLPADGLLLLLQC